MPCLWSRSDVATNPSNSRRLRLRNLSTLCWRTIFVALLLLPNTNAFFTPATAYMQVRSIGSKYYAPSCLTFPYGEGRYTDLSSLPTSSSTHLKLSTSPLSSTSLPLFSHGKEHQQNLRPQLSWNRRKRELRTLLRVGLPSILAGLLAYLIFPGAAILLASSVSSSGALTVLSTDSSQFVQNFLSVSSLLFSILVGQTYYFLYTQQESIYYALFHEVTEAKSLLEQVALVCQGRSMYPRCLQSMINYVQNDLKQIRLDPAVLLSARPVDDPLESIMYMTSVGVPSTVYDTVKSLREARARRLGALQRKLPSIHMLLLWILAAIELVSFPLLGAGTQTIGGYNLLTIEGILFGVMTSGIVLTLRVVGELWRPAGGAYNVDNVLSVMVSGLENELQARLSGRTTGKVNGDDGSTTTTGSPSNSLSPSGALGDITPLRNFTKKSSSM